MNIMRTSTYKSIALFSTVAALLPLASWTAQWESPLSYTAAQQESSVSAADSLDDGPHVYWQTDSRAIVFYLCDEQLVQRVFEDVDTVRFNGFCGDSAVEYVIPAQAPTIEPQLYDGVPKIFTVSDVHGEYQALVELLENAGVVDAGLHWSWGEGHLVIDGDIFDRGDKVTECLWLIYRLEQEARREGGQVHVLLGNHEIMVMQDDLRYVNEKYTNGIVRRSGIDYDDLFGPDMELGRWLRSKHIVIKLNDILFVHAGISPDQVARGLSLEDVNETAQASIDLRSYALAFSDTAEFIFGRTGPTWYRGYHYGQEGRYPKASLQTVEAALSYYGATAVVVGHTEIPEVTALYEGKVFAVDVPLLELGSLQGLLWQGGRFYRVTGAGTLEPLE